MLPARKETVRNAFLDRLRERCERAIFETIARLSPAADLPYRTWKRGCEVLGRKIEHGPIRLHEWQPLTAENWRDVYDGPDESREEARTGLIVPSELSGPEQVLLQHGAQRDAQAAGLQLWRAERRYEGYTQYDAMRRVRGLRVVTTDEGGVKTEASGPDAGVANGLVERIDLVVQTTEHDRSNPKSFAIASDIGFANLHDDNQPHQVGIPLERRPRDRAGGRPGPRHDRVLRGERGRGGERQHAAGALPGRESGPKPFHGADS